MRLIDEIFTGSERETSEVSEGVGGLFLNHSVVMGREIHIQDYVFLTALHTILTCFSTPQLNVFRSRFINPKQ